MILIIDGPSCHPRLEEAYALRARILHARLGWAVNVVGGKEMDELDDLPAVHMLYLVNDVLTGYLRLLPMTGPTVLERYFGDVFKERPQTPGTWEVSKFCVECEKSTLPYHSSVMLAGLGEYCWRHDIELLTGVVNEKILRAYNRGGITLTVLEQAELDGKDIYNITYQMTKENLKTMAAWFGDSIMDEATLVQNVPENRMNYDGAPVRRAQNAW